MDTQYVFAWKTDSRPRHIKCAQCRFARPDRHSSTRNWTAIECRNLDSDYYKALLNVTEDGDMQDEVTWEGCEWGEAVSG